NRSPRTPQIGLAIAIETPDALAEAAAQRSSSRPLCTPRSCDRKMDRNGNANENPKMAVNSANQSAARFRFQSTVDGGSGKQFEDAVGRHRDSVDHHIRLHLPDGVLDRAADGSGHRYRAALAGALESFWVGVGRRINVQ